MKKIVFLLMAFGFVISTSCEKEDTVHPVTKEIVPTIISGNGVKRLPPYDGGQ